MTDRHRCYNCDSHRTNPSGLWTLKMDRSILVASITPTSSTRVRHSRITSDMKREIRERCYKHDLFNHTALFVRVRSVDPGISFISIKMVARMAWPLRGRCDDFTQESGVFVMSVKLIVLLSVAENCENERSLRGHVNLCRYSRIPNTACYCPAHAPIPSSSPKAPDSTRVYLPALCTFASILPVNDTLAVTGRGFSPSGRKQCGKMSCWPGSFPDILLRACHSVYINIIIQPSNTRTSGELGIAMATGAPDIVCFWTMINSPVQKKNRSIFLRMRNLAPHLHL